MMKHKLKRVKKTVHCPEWLKKTMLLLVFAAFAGTLHLWTLHNAMAAPDTGGPDPNPDITYNGNDIEYDHYAWPGNRSGNKNVPDDEADSEIDVIFLPWDCYDYTDDEVEVESAWINWDGGGLYFKYTYQPIDPICAYSGTFKSELEDTCEGGGGGIGGNGGGEGGEDDPPEFTLDVEGNATQTLVIYQQSVPFAYARPFILCVDDELTVESALQTNSGTTTVFSEWSVNGNAALNNSETFDIPDDFPAAFLDTDGNANPAQYDLDATYECPVTQETLTANAEVVVLKVDLMIANGGNDLDNGENDSAPPATMLEEENEGDPSGDGAFLLVNWDDDDEDGEINAATSGWASDPVPDLDENPVGSETNQVEDNLAKIAFSLTPMPVEGTVKLELTSGGSHVKLWDTPWKANQMTTLDLEWDLSTDTLPEELWLEGISASSEKGVSLRLKYLDAFDDEICSDTVKATVVMIHLGNAVYCKGGFWVGEKGHGALVVYYTGVCNKTEVNTENNFGTLEMPGDNSGPARKNLSDITGEDAWGCYTKTNITHVQRLRIVGTAKYLHSRAISIEYVLGNVLDPEPWGDNLKDITRMRCDGFIETCYEWNDIDVWGKIVEEATHYDICINSYQEEHNDFSVGFWKTKLFPATQSAHDSTYRSKKWDTTFNKQDLCEPIGTKGGN